MTTSVVSTEEVRAALIAREEIALLDVREEDPFAQSHPLWAANLPLSKLELEAWGRIPRRDTRIVVYDDGEGLTERAAARLRALGYTDVNSLDGGLAGWREAGGELFRDVNVPSKSFGELVESKRHTPSLSAQDVQALLAAKADVVVLDARRFDEYQTMNIPGSTSVPGGELVLRARELAPDPATRVIVNCAGRTRSIIGTQSLVNASLPNPVAALRNGTIGWTLAGQSLEHGASRRFDPAIRPEHLEAARGAAADVARRAGVSVIGATTLAQWLAEPRRTTYRFDVRTPEEYAAGHRAGFRSAPGGQLVQETDVHAPVRGARIVLSDDDGVRASMAASWLAQMGWDVAVLDAPPPQGDALETGPDKAPQPAPPAVRSVTPATLADWLATGDAIVVDVTLSANYVKRHVPGAAYALRSQLPELLPQLGNPRRLVLTCGSSLLARFAAEDIQALTASEVLVLEGGTAAWVAAGLPVEAGETRLLSPRIDRYRRPYEGTDNAASAMQAYLDWEFGLVEQLGRDGTHHFFVV
ncbi:rhodanese-related sulfurtransferase [Paucibacter sp. R3-3]|uniref:Rhodanese-related sulfurtransferase n=1 Tax=Roseateles agri TaxID=3098619 RepID=A0ABU5DRS3_9BURK|nr:rhodanese-related sulfurtransferase [Paucibacter sp. R3-3]MDY0747732.1 rhodanese-related sulfurtransferase [Paucibacter sp. R3-3]